MFTKFKDTQIRLISNIKAGNDAQFYQNTFIKNPKSIFAILLITLIKLWLLPSKDFRLDASSETLLIEGDPDLGIS